MSPPPVPIGNNQARPKATATKRHNLVTLTRPNREKLSQPRKVDVAPLPKAKPRTWLAALRANELEATALRHASTPTQLADVPADQSPNSPLSPKRKILCDLHTLMKSAL